MSTTTTNYGLIKPDTSDPILIGQLNDNADIIDATLKSLSDVLDVAKLGIKYKGEVNYYSNLPASGNEIGDAYTVKYAGSSGTVPDGTEYVWGTVSGTNQWINFSKDSYTKAEVDALLSLKANIADIPAPSTAAPAMDGTAAAGTSTDYARADHVHPSDTSKQNALTTSQLAAVNSGIDSTKVSQIETNKNNISSLNDEINSTPKVVYKKSLLVSAGTTIASTGLEYTIPGVVAGNPYRITAVAAYNASQPDEIRLVNKANGALYGVAVRNTIAANASVTVTGCVTVGVNITIEVQAKYVAAGNNYIHLIVEKISM